jgi:hypothetical protein
MGVSEVVAGRSDARPIGRDTAPFRNVLLAVELALLVSVFAVFLQGQHPLGDAKYSLLVSENLLHGKGFAIDENSVAKPAPQGHDASYPRRYPYQLEAVNGKLLYFYPVGSSILAVPLVALMNVAGFSALAPDGRYDEEEERFIQGVLAAFLMAILTVIFFRTALLALPLSWSAILAVGVALSTQVWSTASRSIPSHTWQILILAAVIYVLLAEEERGIRGHPVGLATLLSWAYCCRPTSSIPIAAISGYILILRRREFVTVAITGACWLVVFLIYSLTVWGRLLPDYYLFHLSSAQIGEGLAAGLISPSRGLFVYVPSTAFALFLVGHYFRVLTHLGLAIVSMIVIAIHLMVTAMDPMWWGGHSFGPRLLTDLVPWFFLLAVLGSRALMNDRASRFRSIAIAFGLLTVLVGACINGRGALVHSARDWDNHPDVDQHPERVWDWSNPQFLASTCAVSIVRLGDA